MLTREFVEEVEQVIFKDYELSDKKKKIYKKIVKLLAESSTCDRAKVGCLILKEGRIVATGYNGSLPGYEHCDKVGHLMHEGHCVRTVHAEQNALMFMSKHGISSKGCDMIVTHMPCIVCMKLIVQSGIKRVYHIEDYRNNPIMNNFNGKIELEKI